MFPTMSSASKVNGILFIAMIAVMFVYSVPKLWGFAETQTEAAKLYADGQLSRKFEEQYDSGFFARESAIKAWSNLSFWLFREGLTGVVVGEDGWLYTNEEFTFPNDLDARLERQMARVEKTAARIGAQGKKLIIVPIPMKADIYGDHVSHGLGERPALLYTRFTEQLSKRNIPFSPLREVYLASKDRTQLFFKKDTHWTPEGAKLAAQQIALSFPDLLGDELYRTEVIHETQHAGDLVNFIKVSPWLDPEIYSPEPLARYQTIRVEQKTDASALFGNNNPSVVLVGSSYTKMDEWNFEGFLKEHLKTDLLSIAVEQKGQFVAMDEFLASDLLADDSVETVIWEFPVRSLITQASESSGWSSAMEELF